MHKESLFNLIKSLNRNEKGYFKKFVSSRTDSSRNNYIKLFDIIDKQDVYDEAALKEKVDVKKIAKNLSVYKNYLYGSILKSLRSYHQEISVDATLHEMLRDAEILFNKSLLRDCESVIRKAISLAYKHEKFTALLDLYALLHRLIMQLENSDDAYQQSFTVHFQEQQHILNANLVMLQYIN